MQERKLWICNVGRETHAQCKYRIKIPCNGSYNSNFFSICGCSNGTFARNEYDDCDDPDECAMARKIKILILEENEKVTIDTKNEILFRKFN